MNEHESPEDKQTLHQPAIEPSAAFDLDMTAARQQCIDEAYVIAL